MSKSKEKKAPTWVGILVVLWIVGALMQAGGCGEPTTEKKLHRFLKGTWVCTVKGFPAKTKVEFDGEGNVTTANSMKGYKDLKRMDGYDSGKSGPYKLKKKEFTDTGEPYWELRMPWGYSGTKVIVDIKDRNVYQSTGDCFFQKQ